MNKLLNVLLMGSVLVLAGCGGDSDSSGSYNYTDSNEFVRLSSCAIRGNEIFVKEENRFTNIGPDKGCKVSRPDLINGRAFALECEIQSNGDEFFTVKSSSNRDNRIIGDDIQSANGKYIYTCLPQVRLPQAGPAVPIQPSTPRLNLE